jgi:glycine cleavage system aminomethyltransferase T
MSKFLVQGRGAGALLDRLSTARVNGGAGVITYTQMLNERGTLEADLTVTKLPERSPLTSYVADGTAAFLVVATDTAHRHVESLLQRASAGGIGGVGSGDVVVTDVSGGLAQINVQGPNSRRVLQRLVEAYGGTAAADALANDAFPFRAARMLDLGAARVVATRITYVGELGFELFVPAESAVYVYEQLLAAGEPLGLAHVGLRALGSLRMEKGYRDYGHDLDNTDTLLEAGLGFTADFDKEGGFIGKEATLEQKERGTPTKRLLQVLLDDPTPMLYHGEVVYRDGQVVGDIRAASYGHTLGGAIGLCMVEAGGADALPVPITAKWINSGTWEVDVAGVRYPARASLRPMYDPKNEKIKA